MPRTWDEVTRILGINASPFDPKANALAASYYMGRLVREWDRDRPDIQRLRLAQASYNGGLGNVLKAQTRCNDALLWEDIMPCVAARETREYVGRIARWYDIYVEEEG
jgi:membrane-bound lytic murein transglycosylase F